MRYADEIRELWEAAVRANKEYRQHPDSNIGKHGPKCGRQGCPIGLGYTRRTS